MGDKKRQTATLAFLGLAAGAVLIGTAAAMTPQIRVWYWNRYNCWHGPDNLAPPIDTTVREVEIGRKSVVLSAGIDQGLQPGHVFTIYRGDRFVGKVRVAQVKLESSQANVLFTNDGEPIKIGDNAATQI
jgi:hypothetical protein